MIYPTYTPLSGAEAGNSTTQLWGLEIDHTGDYVGTPPEPLTGAGRALYPPPTSPPLNPSAYAQEGVTLN